MSVIGFLLVMITLYYVGSMGVIWALCALLDCTFNLAAATGVWLIIHGIYGAIRRRKRK